MTQPKIKILVCYHKPSELFKSDILVPIHAGRAVATNASKDGVISDADYKWLLDNMIGDDTDDNISNLNRFFNETTAIYWAWKNYDKLGNPDYIGLSHYRRLFKDKDIESATQYDMTVVPSNIYKTIKEQYNGAHDINHLNMAIDILKDMYPEYNNAAKEYLNQNIGYWFNMFIMKKELFFEYCEFLFGVLLKLHKKIDYDKIVLDNQTKPTSAEEQLAFDNLNRYNQRVPAFLAERLTGIFITHKKKTCSVNEVSIRFLSDNKPIMTYKFKKILHTILSYITFGKMRERQKQCIKNYKDLLD